LRDPWGTLYKVEFNSTHSEGESSKFVENYETVVFLPNRNRCKYE
jgi:hypothetical protein